MEAAILGSYLLAQEGGWTCQTLEELSGRVGINRARLARAIAELEASGEVLRKGERRPLLMSLHDRRRDGILCVTPYWALHRFGKTPSMALLIGRLRAVEGRLRRFCELLPRAQVFVPAQRHIAQDLGMSESRIYKMLRVLQRLGLVRKNPVKRIINHKFRCITHLFLYAASVVFSFETPGREVATALVAHVAAKARKCKSYVQQRTAREEPPSERYYLRSTYTMSTTETAPKESSRPPPRDLQEAMDRVRNTSGDARRRAFRRYCAIKDAMDRELGDPAIPPEPGGSDD